MFYDMLRNVGGHGDYNFHMLAKCYKNEKKYSPFCRHFVAVQ